MDWFEAKEPQKELVKQLTDSQRLECTRNWGEYETVGSIGDCELRCQAEYYCDHRRLNKSYTTLTMRDLMFEIYRYYFDNEPVAQR